MDKHLNIKVYGRVQGIFFRATAKEQADRFGIRGFAENKEDGSVYIEVEGEETKLNQFLDWCHKGPSLAEITDVKVTEGNLKNFTEFLI